MTIPLDHRLTIRVTADLDVQLVVVDDGDLHVGRIVPPALARFTPDEAATIAAQLIAAADEAVHESRRRRRDVRPEPPRLLRSDEPDPYGLGFDPFGL